MHLLAPACTRLHLLAPAHTFRTRAGVRTCEFSHIRTFTHISKNFFAKQNSGSHTMHVAHILHACGCADVRNFAHPHFHTHFQKFFCKKKNSDSHTVVVNFFDQALFTLHEPWYKQTCVHRYEVSTKSKILVQKQSQPIVFQFVNLGGSIQ